MKQRKAIIARFKSRCRCCNKHLAKGTTVFWLKDEGVLCFNCNYPAVPLSRDIHNNQHGYVNAY